MTTLPGWSLLQHLSGFIFFSFLFYSITNLLLYFFIFHFHQAFTVSEVIVSRFLAHTHTHSFSINTKHTMFICCICWMLCN